MTPCPTEDVFVALSEGRLSPTEQQHVEAHLDECAECRVVVGAFIGAGRPGSTRTDPEAEQQSAATPPPSRDGFAHHQGDVVHERYVLERLLASGGMGSVWVAKHLQLDTKVAIKFMNPQLLGDAAARSRFEGEAKAAAALRSPYVVQILDYGTHDGAPYLAMELLEGEDLRTYLLRHGRVPLDVASIILTQICKALQFAADSGIVHRDLKPGNIFLARAGDEKTVKVLDFGLAKAFGAGQRRVNTKTGVLLGTPYYMSPEQARGHRVIDHRSDLWSAAAMLFEMIVGQKPFRAVHGEVGDILVRICADPLPLPSELEPSLPPEIDAFFARAFVRDPAKRFQSARELAGQFAQIAARHLERPDLVTFHSGGLEITWSGLHVGQDLGQVEAGGGHAGGRHDTDIAEEATLRREPSSADEDVPRGASTTAATTRTVTPGHFVRPVKGKTQHWALWGAVLVGGLVALGVGVGGAWLLDGRILDAKSAEPTTTASSLPTPSVLAAPLPEAAERPLEGVSSRPAHDDSVASVDGGQVASSSSVGGEAPAPHTVAAPASGAAELPPPAPAATTHPTTPQPPPASPPGATAPSEPMPEGEDPELGF